MEAGKQLRCVAWMLAISFGMPLAVPAAYAANYRTQNFIVDAPTPELARAVGEAAEGFRNDLAEHWLGQPIAPWPTPCPVRVIAGPNLAAQGVTTYNRSPVRDFQMEVVGTPERILDSVLPHEVTHTVLASHFGRPLPRWADEGICTTVEHESERRKHEMKLREFLSSRRGIAMNRMFLLTEYPNDVLPLYAQGYSVCRFLIEQKGPQAFIAFLEGYMQHPSWTDNVREHYGYESLGELQEFWLGWVSAGSGPVTQFVKNNATRPADASLASAAGVRPTPLPETTPRATMPPAGPNHSATPTIPASPAVASLAGAKGDGGWYLRRKRGEVSEEAPVATVAASEAGATRELLATPVPQTDTVNLPEFNPVPPSVRNSGWYTAAQPQPERSFLIPISADPPAAMGNGPLQLPTAGGPVRYSPDERGHFWR